MNKVDRSDVVVIGGGILGCATALQLLAAGVSHVRLLERDDVGGGTTAAGGGFLGNWTPQGPETAAYRYGREFYSGLHAAGVDIDYRENSMLYVAASESAWEDLGRDGDPSTRVVSPQEIEELTGGIVRAAAIRGGLHDRDGAQVHAPKVAAALAARVRAAGGIIDTRRPVTEITTRGGRVEAVQTAHGPVACDAVVVAAGAWSSDLCRQLGFFLPVVPQVTSRITTGARQVPLTLPTLFFSGLVPDEPGGGTMLWVRGHHGGLVWGGTYDVHPRHIFVDAPVPDRLDELPIDGVLEILRVADRGAEAIPSLPGRERLVVKHGAPCYTPDMRALVGPIPGVSGGYVLAGDNESGITYGPGYAKALAELITGRQDDANEFGLLRPDRFGDTVTTQQQVLDAMMDSYRAM
ncbi:NAD(P)/FAD-dependent oxidoreductase [Plantactinospora sp. CA-290183]|uniref:NAD(P)/FAD-dependent oxidoreductase n=1 Tax=Plantactinospora sp. CA-290183 TaxID=3240006 RepID=UPI003D8B2546